MMFVGVFDFVTKPAIGSGSPRSHCGIALTRTQGLKPAGTYALMGIAPVGDSGLAGGNHFIAGGGSI